MTPFLTKIAKEIYTISGIFTPQECRYYIRLSELYGFEAAKVHMPSGQKMVKNIRNNDRVMMISKDISEKIESKVAHCLPQIFDDMEAMGLNDLIRFYRYNENQRFKMHKDGRYKASDTVESRLSFLLYLNDNYTGGETKFRNQKIKIKPKSGMALCFVHEQWHEGSPLIEGQKYVLRTDVMYKKKQ